jgi:hypothetical protein
MVSLAEIILDSHGDDIQGIGRLLEKLQVIWAHKEFGTNVEDIEKAANVATSIS